jgi:hypothetical protein
MFSSSKNKQPVPDRPDNYQYTYENLSVVNLIKKEKFKVITKDGDKHEGYLKTNPEYLVVLKYDKKLSSGNKVIDQIEINYDNIENIEYQPRGKVDLMRYYLVGLVGIFITIGLFG